MRAIVSSSFCLMALTALLPVGCEQAPARTTPPDDTQSAADAGKDVPAGEPAAQPPADAAKPPADATQLAADATQLARADASSAAAASSAGAAKSGPVDCAQWGGSPGRNNVPDATNVPSDWNPGEFDRKTGDWKKEKSKNIKWVAKVGSQTYGNPVVADGRVFVGTNNGAGYLDRYASSVDLGCLVCFDIRDGKFLWQHSSEKLPTGRVHDWPLQGICCAPMVEGKRLWFVTSRGEVRCLDTEGFHDDENDGPYKEEQYTEKDEADVIWVYDMMRELNVSQHNMCSCSVTAAGNILFVNTSNGLDESHINLPQPNAPSFIALDKNTGKLLWADKSPGENILHGQWSSPTYGVLGGVPQVIFGGGDGWVYSFHGEKFSDGKPELLWKFDANPKETKWIVSGEGTRNNIIATPVIYDGLVYVAVGQDPEHGEGPGNLWCIDPTKRGDVSPQLAFNVDNLEKPIPHKRIQAVIPEEGEVARANPNSAAVWRYFEHDLNEDGKIEFEETMHRSCGTVAIKDDILYIADFSGLFHCLDAKTGEPHGTYDMLAAAWGSPLIVDGKVYIGDEDGDVAIFKHGKELEEIAEINMRNSVYSTPIFAGGTLYISNRSHLFAIGEDE